MSELKILSYCNIIAKFPPLYLFAVVAQLVEHVIGNDEVTGSIPVNGSIFADIVQWQNTAFVKQERGFDSHSRLQIILRQVGQPSPKHRSRQRSAAE